MSKDSTTIQVRVRPHPKANNCLVVSEIGYGGMREPVTFVGCSTVSVPTEGNFVVRDEDLAIKIREILVKVRAALGSALAKITVLCTGDIFVYMINKLSCNHIECCCLEEAFEMA